MPKSALSGTRIRALRNARRLGQADLARLAGVSASYLNLIEHNRRRATPKVLEAIAEALQIPASALDENAGEALLETLRAAAARAPATAAETDRVEELTGRFPGWAALIAQMHARTEALERTVERLSDRMAHDPNLSASLHEIVSAATSVQSTTAILAESEELEPQWRAVFHANVHADSVRLASAAEALVAFLDTTGEDTALAAPLEEVESWLDRQGWHVAAVEDGAGGSDWSGLVGRQADLATAAAREMAAGWLSRAQADARALPLDSLVPPLRAMFAAGGSFAPEALARSFGVGLAQMFRRLATLPALPGVPRFGLAVCDGSGTLTLRRPIEGFHLPRFGGACPLWPLYQALVQPDRPLRATVEFAGRPPIRFVAHAVAGARDPMRFEPPFIWSSSMLLTPASALAGAEAGPVVPVGSACRVCPRNACAARREPSIITGGGGAGADGGPGRSVDL